MMSGEINRCDDAPVSQERQKVRSSEMCVCRRWYRSGAAASVMPEEMLPNVTHSERVENEFCRVTDGTTMDQGGQKTTFKTRNGSTQSMNFRVAAVTKASASVTKM